MPPDKETAQHGDNQRAAQVNKQTNNNQAQQKVQAEPVDTITVLYSAGHHYKRLAKRFYKGEGNIIKAEGYGKQKHFQVSAYPCNDVHELAHGLGVIESISHACIVRGEPVSGVNKLWMLRRSHARGSELATLRNVPRRYAMIDVDKIPCPPGTDPAVNALDAALYAVGLLPAEFQDISFFYQFSSSQGIENNDTLSVHLWFYFDRFHTNAELRRWAKAVNKMAGYKLVDVALFEPAQVHYTARPIFDDGIKDPLPVRSGFWQGLEDTVTLNIPTEETDKPAYKKSAEYRPGLGYCGYLARIGDNKDGFHDPIVSAIASCVAINGVDNTDVEAVKGEIRHAIDAALSGHRSADVIERYKSDVFLDDIFKWVLAREQEKPRMPESVTSLPPYFPFPDPDRPAVSSRMRTAITTHISSAVAWAKRQAAAAQRGRDDL